MTSIPQVIAAIFILLGAMMALTAAIGIVRFSDTLSRLHAASKPQVVGLIMVLIGAVISLRGNVDIWMLILVGVFIVATAPVIAHTVGRVAYREQRGRDGLLIVNEIEPDADTEQVPDTEQAQDTEQAPNTEQARETEN